VARIVYTDISGQERSVPCGPDSPVVTIGRATDCTIRSNRKSVSRRHAEFRYSNGQFEIVDLNSSNGTYLIINDERKPVVGRDFLAPNDEVWCGDFILHFLPEEDDVPTYSGGHAEFREAAGASGHDGGYDSGGYDSPGAPGGYDSPAEYDSPGGYDSGGGYDSPGGYDQASGYGGSGYQAGPGQYQNLDEGSSTAWGQTEPPPPVDGPDATRERSSEIERLEAEKKSIEDLASRQAHELEDLQRLLDEEREKVREFEDKLDRTAMVASNDGELQKLRDELVQVREEKRRLEEKLHTALQKSDRAQEFGAKLEEAQSRVSNLEAELESANTRVGELEASLERNAAVLDEADELREAALASKRDLEALEGEVERLQAELDENVRARRDAESRISDHEEQIEQAEALQREVERHARLVEEFERRNRDLQTELDDARIQKDEAKSHKDKLQSRIDDLETELETARVENDRLSTELADAREEMDASAEDRDLVEDLRTEIEGLKQRLKLEKKRGRQQDEIVEENAELQEKIAEYEARVDELQGELEVLRERISHAPSPEPGAAVEGLDAEVLSQLLERIDALDRIVDAIERTDLEALSTVDRVRLQSAIRETAPRKNLAELKSMLGAD